MSSFTHVDEKNNPCMVNVEQKDITVRQATAQSIVNLPPEVLSHFSNNDINSPKGPVFHTAIIAGTMAVKKTHELIPFCHPLNIEGCRFDIKLNEEQKVVIKCTVSLSGKTGVEMEALTGASVAALTIYDMCKAFSKKIVIEQTELLEKSGGKSDFRKDR